MKANQSGLLARTVGRLEGPQTLGRGWIFWLCFLAVVVALALAPLGLGRYQIINFSNFLTSGLLALSLCLIWGYCGILSLGQAAFYGIGGYAYGIVGINLLEAYGETHLALLAGILAPVVLAALVGGLMFYSRLKGVYVAILMLVLSLLLGLFMRQTADPSYTIGKAYLGGMNGLRPATSDAPQLPSLIFRLGDWAFELDGRGREFFWFMLAVVVLVYLGLRWLVNSSYGYLLVACREDSDRTETFGYDVRLIQLSVFCLSAGLAGLSGALYTAWGTYIHPDGFSVAPNILVVIWVAVGGRKDLGAALVGSFLLNWISLRLASVGEISLLVLGLILVTAMLLAPEGVIVRLAEGLSRLGRRRAAGGGR